MAYMKNLQASAKSLGENNVLHIAGEGVPTSGTSGTGLNVCGPGSFYFDVTNAALYQNSNTAASPTWSVAAGAALRGSIDGLGNLRVARATFDPSANASERTVAAHGLGVTLPDNAIVCGGFYDVITTFTSPTSDTATIALSVQSANDIVVAVAIATGTPYDIGLQAIVPKANTPESTGIKLTAARELTATIAVEAVTAGKLILYVYYTISV